jgi:ABC-type multidrug transport system fused ATPase/permease subunit
MALDRLLAGRTSIVIAHRLSTVRKADAIAVVEGGRILEIGNHDALLRSRGLYAKLWTIQSEHGDIKTIEGLLNLN